MPTVTIPRRWFSSLPLITVEISAEFAAMPDGIQLGAAVKMFVANAQRANTRADLTDADLTRADLTDADLTGTDLTDADLTSADLTGADLTNADLTRTVLNRAVLNRAVLTGADLTRADLTRTVLTDAVLTGAVLTDADLTRTVLTDADLTGTDLTRAVLTDGVLTRAVLTGTDLTRAVLTRADLTRADLGPIRGDFFDVLRRAEGEVPALLAALRAGKVDGSTYTGACACLAGTIANARGVHYETLDFVDSDRPAERWFLAIKKRDTPATNPVAKITERWIEEFMALAGAGEPDEPAAAQV
jgi:hypothetical protein